MGLMRWLRGGDENSATANAISAGLAEIDGLFRPSRHKQTEHVEEHKRRRVDVSTGAGVDLDRGVVVMRRRPVAGADDPVGHTTGDGNTPGSGHTTGDGNTPGSGHTTGSGATGSG